MILRMIKTGFLKTVFNKHTAFALTINGIEIKCFLLNSETRESFTVLRIPVTLGGTLNILMENDETNTELLCGIVRDSLALQGAISHTWAMITVIFR